MLTSAATAVALGLVMLNGGYALQQETRTPNDKYFYTSVKNSMYDRNCIKATFNGEKNVYTQIESPDTIVHIIRSYDSDTEYLRPDSYPEKSWWPATLVTFIRWGKNKGPWNTVAVQSCNAHCVVEPKKPAYCHDPVLASKCSRQPNRFTQSINPNATLVTKKVNPNKVKSWKAKPRF